MTLAMARMPTFAMDVTGPYRVRLGSYPYQCVFDQLDPGAPVWQCNEPAGGYNADGMALYLYNMRGRWEVGHGPGHLWHHTEFLAAQYLGQVATVWGSWDDIMEPGPHNWEQLRRRDAALAWREHRI